MSQAKVNEWLHADRGAPWKHRADGGLLDPPQISREDDAEVMSHGRPQNRGLDLNMTPPPAIRAPLGPIQSRPDATWLPGPIPNDRIDFAPARGHHVRAAYGGGIHRDIGGGILDPSNGLGGQTPNVNNQNPNTQSALQSYAQMSPEQLQETLSRLGGPGSPQGQVVERVLRQKQMQPAQLKRGGPMKRDSGGVMSASEGSPWWTRSDARSEAGSSGFLHGVTPGRGDKVQTTAPGGSYVIPSDVIAGLGSGNSLAGARIMDGILSTGPGGISLPRSGGGRGIPRAPAPYHEQAARGGLIVFSEKRAAGGVKSDNEMPVMLSHGEYVVAPHHCTRIGKGDIKAGHRVLDSWVLEQRKRQVKKIKNLPPPVKA